MAPNILKTNSFCESCNLNRYNCICRKVRELTEEEVREERENQQRIEEERRRNEERQRQIEEFQKEIQTKLDEFNQYKINKLKEIENKKEQIKNEFKQVEKEKQSFIKMKETTLNLIYNEFNEKMKVKSEEILSKITYAIEKKQEILDNLLQQENNCLTIEKLIVKKYENLKVEYEHQFELFKHQILNENN
jgi:dynein heavy chain, axonemal